MSKEQSIKKNDKKDIVVSLPGSFVLPPVIVSIKVKTSESARSSGWRQLRD